MAKRIKLENIVSYGFNRQTGKLIEEETLEFVCKACRHLVSQDDKFCWQCGEKLEASDLVEHYYKGGKITDEEYQRRRKPKY